MTCGQWEKIVSVEFEAFLSKAVGAALEAGRAILGVYHSDDFDVQLKSDDSPLTRADRLAHNIITSHLNSSSSTHNASLLTDDTVLPILSEEGAAIPYEDRKNWSRFWLVDPLDGTKEFIKRNGEFTVNIALIEGDRPSLGVVYAPDLDRLYFGTKGVGAFRLDNAMEKLNGLEEAPPTDSLIARSILLPLKDTIHLSPSTIHQTPSTSRQVPGRPSTGHREAPLRVVASRSHLNEATRAVIDKLQEKAGAVELVQAGSSLKLCLVAEGSADLYPRLGPTMEWDTAAAHAVVSAAGGRVVRLPGKGDLLYNKPDLLNPHFMVFSRSDIIPSGCV